MSDRQGLEAPTPSRADLKHLATWRARFYGEAAARANRAAGSDTDAFDRWYRDELERAPALNDEAAMDVLWNTLDTAATAGSRLRAVRKHYRLTQIDMAAIAGVEQGTVSRWEADETDITDTHLTIYSYLCQGAALAFLRYGAETSSRPRQPDPPPSSPAAPARSSPVTDAPPPAELSAADVAVPTTPALQVVGRVGSGQAVTPTSGAPRTIEIGDPRLSQAGIDSPSEFVALELDDTPDLYPLRPSWLILYARAPDPRDDALAGLPAPLESCHRQLCIVGLTDHPDNRGNAGRVVLREVRAARAPGRYELATFRTYDVENADIAWASPVIALLPG